MEAQQTQQRSSEPPVSSAESAPQSEAQTLAVRNSRAALMFALLLGLCWLSALAWLTLFYSNPVTLNRLQIQQADFVALGTFDGKMFDLRVTETWPKTQDLAGGTIRLQNAQELHASRQRAYLVPISIRGGKSFVTPSPLQGRPLIYPASEAALEQLQQLLNQHR